MAKFDRIAVLGTGAVGGLYGGRLAQAGNDVHFLAKSDFAVLKSRGLQVRSPAGDFELPSLNVYDSASAIPQADLVVVTWKTTSNDHLQSTLEPLCHAETLVLVLQNGLDSEQAAAEVVGADRVLGGCCFLCSNRVEPGVIHHLDYGAISVGEYSPQLAGRISTRLKQLAALFLAAGVNLVPIESLAEARWKKLAWNIPFNGLNVVLDSSTDKIIDDRAACQLAEDLMWEVHKAARVAGAEFEESHVSKLIEMTRKMVPYDSSMYLDFKSGRPLEVESIFGAPLRVALAEGYRPRKIEMLYQQLCYLDRMNRKQAD
ncbi:MAG: putative 2-dehydropantoate 2-reductase [Pirellulaceae bacterium]